MLNDADLERYARQVIMPDVGEDGQERLLAARMLVVGAGGLGSPVIFYLAAAGVGHITILDDETVELTNLHRQSLHTTASIGARKVERAAATAAALNPGIEITPCRERLDAGNVEMLLADHNLVIGGEQTGRLLLFDERGGGFMEISTSRRNDCSTCGVRNI